MAGTNALVDIAWFLVWWYSKLLATKELRQKHSDFYVEVHGKCAGRQWCYIYCVCARLLQCC
eukprot:m.132944 g.132944  ORF g.132944 m.132944 type:complete len:62 (-) comp17515_c0_seq3:125-310(-)